MSVISRKPSTVGYCATRTISLPQKKAKVELLALFVFWLWRLARAHPAVTSGRVEADGLDQAWLSWMTLCWVGLTLAQMAITVAGNQGWLPLTGITFPFISFGLSSLLVNALFLGLSLHLHRRL